MLQFHLLMSRGLAPHGYCLLWDPVLIWLHVVSDAVIALSYLSIPVVLTVFLSRRRDIEFGWLLLLFAIFITACGTTHLMSILVLWVPAYGLEGIIKAITAVASVLTAIALWPLLPRLLALPSPRQLQQANEALRQEAAERSRMEEQLRQSQKLEAIGQLTGGIAHDFNNILTVIMGNIERATRRMDAPDQALGALGNAMAASQRAANLTDQLLAFARKQPMTITSGDLNAIVRDMTSMIEITVGEPVRVVLDLAERPMPVDVDRSQLEAALINLAANARDAMPAGGVVTIATAEHGPDTFALRVADTGTGMDVQTMQRATEPFFTTKPVGLGTGLGLSQVYGFANQAGGDCVIVSEPGKGTTVTIVLMRGASPG